MKKTTILLSVALGLLLSTLGGCKANVDLNNIDSSIEASMGLALPVGEISATLGDFLGNDSATQFIQVDKDGVLFFEDTFKISRNFYDVNLAKYVTNAQHSFQVGSIYGGLPLKKDTKYELRFPLSIKLSGVNAPNEDGSYPERIDSIWIREAKFVSNFNVSNFGLPYTDIQKLEIVLDQNFSRAAGKTIDVPLAGASYGTDLPVIVDEFTLNLMKDRTKDPSNANVVDEVNFEFVFTVAPSADITVSGNATIDCGFTIDFLQYHAVWGWFPPSKYMTDRDTINIAEEWSEWNNLRDILLPLAEPHIQLDTYNSIGMPLTVDGEFLFVESLETGDKRYAEFNGNQAWSWSLQNFVHLEDPLDKVVKNTFVFSNNPSNGTINRLFEIRPDLIGYDFSIYPNNSKAEANGIKHYRLSEDTHIDLDAIVHVPFTFNSGVTLSYSDTIDSINIEAYQLDSLIAATEIVEEVEVEQLKLMIHFTNTIPFNIDGEFEFLDEANQPIDIKVTEAGNKIRIAGPTEVENGVVTEPGKNTIIIDINQEAYDKLVKMKRVVFKVALGENTTYVRLLDKSGLKIRLAVAANVRAAANLDSLFNNNEEVAE